MSREPQQATFTRQDFDFVFPDDARCLEWLFRCLYPEGKAFCNHCRKKAKHHRIMTRPSYSCDSCGHHIHPTAGTIFHKSSTRLTTWFYAICLIASTQSEISAKQIERETGVTYKTAWRMSKQIRSILGRDANLLDGPSRPDTKINEPYTGRNRLLLESIHFLVGSVEGNPLSLEGDLIPTVKG